MVPWTLLATAAIPGETAELRLLQRGAEFVIMLDRIELMSSRRSASETALASLSSARIAGRRQPRMLIGGLGMGFTLREALARLGPDARIEVAELVPAVVTWARGPLAPIFGDCLRDPRVAIHEVDVAGLIRAGGAAAWDAIVLDVDNGPDALTRAANDGLYDRAGLAAAYDALRQGGVLAIWSSGSDDAFTRRLRDVGFAVEQVTARAHGAKGPRHVIWIATRGAARTPRPR